MRQRLDALSDATKEVVQVAAVLPDLFTAALLAQMLEDGLRFWSRPLKRLSVQTC